MNKRTYIILALCLLIIGGCLTAYFFLRTRRKTDADPLSDEVINSVLKRGSRGEDVKELQTYLNSQLTLAPVNKARPICNGKQLYCLEVDGIFGEKTECVCLWWFGRTSVKRSEIPDTL